MFQVTFPGPFNHHDVAVNGWLVPFIEAIPSRDETGVTLLLDRRIGVTLSNEESERIIPFLADAIALALGYPCHPDEETDRPQPLPHPRPIRIYGIAAVSSTSAG
jgi:hypothetical protein